VAQSDSAGNFHINTTTGKLYVNGVAFSTFIQQQVEDALASGQQVPPTSVAPGSGSRPVVGSDVNGNLHINTTSGLFVNGMRISALIEQQVDALSAGEQTPSTTSAPMLAARPAFGSDPVGNFHINTTGSAELFVNGLPLSALIQQQYDARSQQSSTTVATTQASTTMQASTPAIPDSWSCTGAQPATTGWYNPIYGPVVYGDYAYIITNVRAAAYHLPTATVHWQRSISDGNGRDKPNQPVVDSAHNQLIFGWDHGVRALHLGNGTSKWQYEHSGRSFNDEGPHFVVQPKLYSSYVCSSSQFYVGKVVCLNRQNGTYAFEVAIAGSRDTRDNVLLGSKMVVAANSGDAVVVDLASTPKTVTVILPGEGTGKLSALAGDAVANQAYFIDSVRHSFYAVSTTTASIVWNVTFNPQYVQISSNPGFDPPKVNTRPAVHQPTGIVFAQQMNGPIHAYASNGLALWQSSRCPFGMGGLVVQGDLVYTSGSTLCALWRFDGSLAWSVNNSNTVEDQSTVAVYDEGRSHLVLAVGVGEVRMYRNVLGDHTVDEGGDDDDDDDDDDDSDDNDGAIVQVDATPDIIKNKSNALYGRSCAATGAYFACGARGYESGLVAIYKMDVDAETATLLQIVKPELIYAFSYFGVSLDMDDDLLVIGAYNAYPSASEVSKGAVWVMKRDDKDNYVMLGNVSAATANGKCESLNPTCREMDGVIGCYCKLPLIFFCV
jgi:hypothetical protein